MPPSDPSPHPTPSRDRSQDAIGLALSRRQFVAAGSVAALAGRALGLPWLQPFAGPFAHDEFPIPPDKKLDPEWVRSLTDRADPPWVHAGSSRFIGMPVGGFFAGTVYLGADGRLWNWDVFNTHHEGCVARDPVAYRGTTLRERDGANYVDPPDQRAPFELGFVLRVGAQTRPLDRRGWEQVEFLGRWPVGTVRYADPATPVRVELDAFSPFVPLDVERSSYPATVMRYTVTNAGDETLEVELAAEFDNPVLVHSRAARTVKLRRESRTDDRCNALVCLGGEPTPAPDQPRPDIPFEDFEGDSYGLWSTEGAAFGDRPRRLDDIAAYQGDLNAHGRGLVNSHNTRQGEDVRQGDAHVGALTSPEFVIERRYINFRIGGGAHEGRTCVDLLVDGEAVRSATGHDDNTMRHASFEVAQFEGKKARLRIVDAEPGPWGNVGVDEIVFSDRPPEETPLAEHPDYGSFCVAATHAGHRFQGGSAPGARLTGASTVTLRPGESQTLTFIVAWHFPNLQIPGMPGRRRWYSARWPDAGAVALDLARNLDELTRLTLLWRDTWYDSSLPWWLLERTIIPTDALATNTCHRLEDGRFWFWEGVGCCHGTCTHVWGYAQAIARLFPEVERYLREAIDFGAAFHDDTGAIDYRAEFGTHVAHDGQCGCVLRAYREHLMSPDRAFLGRVWPRVKRALEFLIAEDADGNGLLEGAQYNTLDAAWFGPMAWISSLYLGALAAGRAMAHEMGDDQFADRCARILDAGSRNMVTDLFNGEYFIHKPDPAHPEANSTNDGCHIDQLYGQAWAHQVGLGRIVPQPQAAAALQSLWKYSFAPDVGVYRDWIKPIQGGRWYAAHGEAGLLMCTFPKGGAERATGQGQSAWAAMYFNECMTGFEYQAAAHMIWEGLVQEGLAITRAIHDRYSPERRNPYNEIECSDHYGRAMAAYGVYLAVCAWEYDGPRGWMAFAPRIRPESFLAAFTAAEGWGQVGQTRDPKGQSQTVEVRAGRLRLRGLGFEVAPPGPARLSYARLNGSDLRATVSQAQTRVRIEFADEVEIGEGERLEVRVH